MNNTILLYTVVMLCLIFLAYQIPSKCFGESKKKSHHFYVRAGLCLLFYTIFWGIRYDVGTDYLNYQYIFSHETIKTGSKEVGLYVFNDILKFMGFDSTSFFIVTSFFVFFLLLRYAKNFDKQYLLLLIFFFFTTCSVFSSQNGIRQYIAMMIVIGTLDMLILKKKWYIWGLFMILAFFIHHSVLIPVIVILALFFYPQIIIINKYILLGVYLASVFIGTTMQLSFLDTISDYLIMLDYERYIDRIENTIQTTGSSQYGTGVFLTVVVGSLVILNQEKLLNIKEKGLPYYLYYFFVLGSILMFVFAGNNYLGRMNGYFFDSIFITLAYFTYIMFKSKKVINVGMALISMFAYFALYIANLMTNTNGVVPYQTIFNY